MNIVEKNDPFTRSEIDDYFIKYPLVKVTFIKVSGEIRTFVCTRNADVIDADIRSGKINSTRHYNSDTTISVYVPELNNWRSFIIDNLIEINGVRRLDGVMYY